MQHCESEASCVEKSSYWIHSATYRGADNTPASGIRCSNNFAEHPVSAGKVRVGSSIKSLG